MSKKINKRVGVGMKPLANQATEALSEKDASMNEVQQEAAKDVGLATNDALGTIGRLEAENATESKVENVAGPEPPEGAIAGDLDPVPTDVEDPAGEDVAKEPPAPADASVQNLDPKSCKLTFTGRLDDLLSPAVDQRLEVALSSVVATQQAAAEKAQAELQDGRPRLFDRLNPRLGEQPDGTFNLVLNIPEGLIEPIREQAASDGVTPEEWCRIRFVEMMDSWWEGPKGR